MPAASSPSSSLIVSVGVQCHVGKERTENQDRVTRASTPYGDLFVVADGVGGYQGGAEAAQTTIDGFVSYLKTHGNLSLPDALQQATRTISADLVQRSAANHALHGMGSTVVLCVVHGDSATYAHVGDSRLYLLRDQKLQQLTRDHSVMERLVSQGVLTPAQAREHPDASVLTKALGQSAEVSLDVAELALQPHDGLLLCSDGMWAYASHAEMEAVAASDALSPAAIAEALLNLALKGGGGDNISIQFLRFSPAGSAGGPANARRTAALGTPSRTVWGMPLKMAIPAAALTTILAATSVGLYLENRAHPQYAAIESSRGESHTEPPAGDSSGTSSKDAEHRQAESKSDKKTPAPTESQKPAAGKNSDKSPTPPVSPGSETAKPGTGQASSTTPPAQTSAPAAGQGKTGVVIIQGTNNTEANWANNLKNLTAYLEISEVPGNAECLALEQPSATLYYTAETTAVAQHIQKDLNLDSSALVQKTAEELGKCGGAQIVAMPAAPKPSVMQRAKSGAKSGIDALKKKTQQQGNTGSDPQKN